MMVPKNSGYTNCPIISHCKNPKHSTVDGGNLAPVGRWFLPLHSHDLRCFTVTNSYQLVQDFEAIHIITIYGYIIWRFPKIGVPLNHPLQ